MGKKRLKILPIRQPFFEQMEAHQAPLGVIAQAWFRGTEIADILAAMDINERERVRQQFRNQRTRQLRRGGFNKDSRTDMAAAIALPVDAAALRDTLFGPSPGPSFLIDARDRLLAPARRAAVIERAQPRIDQLISELTSGLSDRQLREGATLALRKAVRSIIARWQPGELQDIDDVVTFVATRPDWRLETVLPQVVPMVVGLAITENLASPWAKAWAAGHEPAQTASWAQEALADVGQPAQLDSLVRNLLEGWDPASLDRDPPWAPAALRRWLTNRLQCRLDAITVRETARRARQAKKQAMQRDLAAAFAASALHDLIELDVLERCLSVGDLAGFLGVGASMQKPRLLLALVAATATDEVTRRRFFVTFQAQLALHPSDVERHLGISKTERQAWTADGRLPVSHRVPIEKYGRTLEVPYYERLALGQLTPEILAQWRGAAALETARNRRLGVRKAKVARARHARLREAVHQEVETRRRSWLAAGDLFVYAALDVALWTMWASRWAKAKTLSARRALTKAEMYRTQESDWYARKNAAVALLARTAYARLSRYVPEDAEKVTFELCDEHRDEFRDLRSHGHYERAWEFFSEHRPAITNCPDCHVREQRHYYSLYLLELDACGDRFSFHTPVPIGSHFLPGIKGLPRTDETHEAAEGWGSFRFGREISEDEAVCYTEALVKKNLDAAMRRLRGYVDACSAADPVGPSSSEEGSAHETVG